MSENLNSTTTILDGVATTSDNPNFYPGMSSDEVYFGQDMTVCLTDVVEGKAELDHTHTGYASQSDLELLEDVVDTKANATHTHTEYASSTHTHSDYATQVALDELAVEVSEKANSSHIHTEYASVSHTHNEYAEANHSHNNYASTTHTHDDYALITHTHTASEVGAASTNHDHDADYASISHTHSDYATTIALSELSAAVSNKANASHSHDDTYYTEAEIDAKLANKSDATHNHSGVYDASGAATSALTSANAYTDSKIDALVGEGASTTLDTIGEISSAIEDNQDAIDLLNSAIGNKASVSDLSSHTSNTSNPHGVTLAQLGVTATSTELNYVDGVTSNIQTQLNTKAPSSHNHDGTYATVSHTHTAGDVEAVATSDVATVLEVETYLGI